MFKEIARLVKTTSINFDISTTSETELRLVIVPKPKEGMNAAMCPPLILVATPEELEEKLASVLDEYMGGVRTMEEVVEDSLLIMAATAKIAQESTTKKTETKAKTVATKTEEPTDATLEADEDSLW